MIAVFIRHADYHQLKGVPSAHQPFALNSAGMLKSAEGAEVLLDTLKNKKWHCHPQIHSSHMLRAWQTADIIRQHIDEKMEIFEFDALAERSVGCLANFSVKQIDEIIEADPRISDIPRDWKRNSHFRLPFQGAESLIMAGQRVAGHIQQRMRYLEVTENNPQLAQLFVGHGAAFRHAAFELGVLSLDEVPQYSMYHAKPVFLEYKNGQFKHVAGDWKKRTDIEAPD